MHSTLLCCLSHCNKDKGKEEMQGGLEIERKIWKEMNFCKKTCSALSYWKHSKLVATAANKGAVNQCVPASPDYKS